MANTTYGYVRVSTKDQNEARQMIAMQEFGIDEKYIFLDKQSGKDFNRPKYQKLMNHFVSEISLNERHPNRPPEGVHSPSDGLFYDDKSFKEKCIFA